MITIPTIAELEASVLSYLATAFPNRDQGPYSWLGQRARADAQALLGIYQALQDADRDGCPTSLTSSERLDEFANLYGVPDGSGTPGKYGRKIATAATGGLCTATGTPALVVGGPIYALAADGVTQVVCTAGFTIGGGGSVATVALDAVTTGTAGNLSPNSYIYWQSAPGGLDQKAIIGTALSGGDDGEPYTTAGDALLLARILDTLRNGMRLTSGDLHTLATGVAGCAAAYVYPRRFGTGTVDVVPLKTANTTGTGSERDPGVVATAGTTGYAVDEALQAERNVGCDEIRTLQPTFGAGKALVVRGTTSASYSWDWTSTGGTWTVDTYPSGDTLHLKLNTLADTTLKDAIDAGRRPYIQIKTTGVVLPVLVQCTGWSDGGGKTTLALAAVPSTAPTAGDEVHAGAAFVPQIAAAILAYSKTLGPSTASGYADTTIPWDDTLRVDQLRRVALSETNPAGTFYLSETVTAPTIDNSATDVQAADALTTAPELLLVSSILVTD